MPGGQADRAWMVIHRAGTRTQIIPGDLEEKTSEVLTAARRVLHPRRVSPRLLRCAMAKPDQPAALRPGAGVQASNLRR